MLESLLMLASTLPLPDSGSVNRYAPYKPWSTWGVWAMYGVPANHHRRPLGMPLFSEVYEANGPRSASSGTRRSSLENISVKGRDDINFRSLRNSGRIRWAVVACAIGFLASCSDTAQAPPAESSPSFPWTSPRQFPRPSFAGPFPHSNHQIRDPLVGWIGRAACSPR